MFISTDTLHTHFMALLFSEFYIFFEIEELKLKN